jgi:hypothetical protein
MEKNLRFLSFSPDFTHTERLKSHCLKFEVSFVVIVLCSIIIVRKRMVDSGSCIGLRAMEVSLWLKRTRQMMMARGLSIPGDSDVPVGGVRLGW